MSRKSRITTEISSYSRANMNVRNNHHKYFYCVHQTDTRYYDREGVGRIRMGPRKDVNHIPHEAIAIIFGFTPHTQPHQIRTVIVSQKF